MEKEFKSESKLSFLEATGIILGHGVGAGILSVPYMASLNNWWDVVWILGLAFALSLFLHLIIGELSYNNNGAMFVKCLEPLFKKEKTKKVVTVIAAVCFGFSVLANCTAYVTGAATALNNIFNAYGLALNTKLTAIIFYLVCATVVFFGMKLVGICEKYCTITMSIIMVIFLGASFFYPQNEFITVDSVNVKFMLALFGMVTFSLSAVMSVPQAVKGLGGDIKKIRWSIILGQTLNLIIVVLMVFVTVSFCGESGLNKIVGDPGHVIGKDGAIICISNQIGETHWLGILGTCFTLFALATSFWANTLDLRDIVHEQFNLGLKLSWVVASIPALILTLILEKTFIGLTAMAGLVQVLTCFGIIAAYYYSRKKAKDSVLVGNFGKPVFLILGIIFALLATIGSFIGALM